MMNLKMTVSDTLSGFENAFIVSRKVSALIKVLKSQRLKVHNHI